MVVVEPESGQNKRKMKGNIKRVENDIRKTRKLLAQHMQQGNRDNLSQPVQSGLLHEFEDRDKCLFARALATLFSYGCGDIRGSLAGVHCGLVRRCSVAIL